VLIWAHVEATMAKAITTTYIDAAVPKVWEFINDLHRKPEYVHFVREVFDIPSHPLREGAVYRERARFGPRESVSEWRVVQFDPPKRQVQQSQSREMDATFTASLEIEGSGTRLTVEMNVLLLPVLRPLGWLLEKLFVQRKVQKDVARAAQNLKRLIESE
jgi:hypothetical protein